MKKKLSDDLPDYTVADMNGSENPFLAGQEQPFEKEERRALVWIALKAALLLGGVFVLAAFLFLLFCVNVWFK